MPDVRLLAALDLHGLHGTAFRRRIIPAEFVASFCVAVGAGVWLALSTDALGWRIFLACVAGIGLNYLPLSLHALSLRRDDALARELAGIELKRALRRYTLLQFWLAVPLLFVVLASWQRVR